MSLGPKAGGLNVKAPQICIQEPVFNPLFTCTRSALPTLMIKIEQFPTLKAQRADSQHIPMPMIIKMYDIKTFLKPKQKKL
jgi:hypothetical protein